MQPQDLKEKTKPEGSMEENICKEGKQLVRGNLQRIFVDGRVYEWRVMPWKKFCKRVRENASFNYLT